MSENLIIGFSTMAFCLAIQCVVVGILFDLLLHLERKSMIKTTLLGLSSLLVGVMLIMLAGNLIQMAIWAGLFYSLGEFKEFTTAFYHSVVNFATLGYGDIVMSEKRRLLGALEAANGVLMFGLTTSFLFVVLNEMVNREWDKRMVKNAEISTS
jgi:hypothetical protein